MRVRVTLDGRLAGELHEDGDAVYDVLDTVMAELVNMEAISPGIEFDRGSSTTSITVNVDADDLDAAVPPASDMIRSALHAAEIGTPGWPASDDPDWSVEFVDLAKHVELVAT